MYQKKTLSQKFDLLWGTTTEFPILLKKRQFSILFQIGFQQHLSLGKIRPSGDRYHFRTKFRYGRNLEISIGTTPLRYKKLRLKEIKYFHTIVLWLKEFCEPRNKYPKNTGLALYVWPSGFPGNHHQICVSLPTKEEYYISKRYEERFVY